MALKPKGLLKRCSSDENTEPIQKKKKKLVDITNSPLPHRNGFFNKTPLYNKTLIENTKITKANSLFASQSPEKTIRDGEKIKKSKSFPNNQSGSARDAQKTSLLGTKELEAAQKMVTKMQVEKDLHGFDGSQITKIRAAKIPHDEIEDEPFDLPFNFYSSFDAYTSEDDNFGLSLEALAELWISYMKNLLSTISSAFFPSPMILHGIVHRGLVHPSHDVRQVCSEYLYTLLFQVHQPRNDFIRTKYLNLFLTNLSNEECKDNELTQAWDMFSSVCKEYLDISNNDRMSGNTLMTRYLVKLLEVDVEYWYESRCLEKCNVEEKSLLEMILWPEGDYGQINFRVKMLLRYYADALGSKKNSQMEPFRRLVSTVAKVVTTFDAEYKEDSRKLSLADYFAKELREGLDSLTDQKLWCEIYMLEPDWLAVEICQKLSRDNCPFIDSRGLRQISNAMETLTICQSTGNATMSIPIMDGESNLSESSMDVVEKKDLIVSGAEGDAKKHNTNSSGSPNTTTKNTNRVWRNKWGETHLHIACRKGEVERVKEHLEDRGNELISLVDHNGWSCLHEAVAHERLECVRMLLNFESPCDILAIKSTEDGLTPLHDAVSNGFVDIAEVLMENFSKGNRVKEALSCLTGDGLTVFQLSTNPAMSELLLKYQKTAAVVPMAPPTLSLPKTLTKFFKVSNPSRLTVILASYVYRYVSCFQIHTVQSLMIQSRSQTKIRNPMRIPRLKSQDYVNTSSTSDYYYREKSIHRTKKIVAEDISTHVKLVSKSKFRKFFVIHT